MDALTLFKGDMTTFQRLYSFLSQILDYGNTEIEKRAIFYRRLLPLLEFGREREGIDLSGVKLTHHSLKAEAKRNLLYGEGDAPKLDGMSDVGSGSLQEKEKARLDEIIARVNDLFEGQLTDDDQLHYVNGFLKSHMLASEELQVQAMANTKAQFDNSPTLQREFLDAVMDSDTAFDTMSRQVLASERLREDLLKILLGPGDLYGALRRMAGANEPNRTAADRLTLICARSPMASMGQKRTFRPRRNADIPDVCTTRSDRP